MLTRLQRLCIAGLGVFTIVWLDRAYDLGKQEAQAPGHHFPLLLLVSSWVAVPSLTLYVVDRLGPRSKPGVRKEPSSNGRHCCEDP